jgi:uncharacterized protein YjbI with pentapeptide repeats
MAKKTWWNRAVAAVAAIVLGATGLVVLDAAPAAAAAGVLDPRFGVGGVRQQAAAGASFEGRAATVDNEGGFVMVGSVLAGGQRDSAIARFDENGGLDAAFPGGVGGTSWDASGTGADDEATGVAVRPDHGDVYTASSSGTTLENSVVRIERRELPSLAVTGAVTMGPGSRDPQLRFFNDKLYVAATFSTTDPVYDVADFDGVRVRRYNPDLTIDTTYGNGGETIFSFGGIAVFQALEVDSLGRVLVGAHTRVSARLGRLDAGGAPDTTFGGGDGHLVFPGDRWITDIAPDGPGGRIAVAGPDFQSVGDVSLVASNGDPDTAFDGDGTRALGGGSIWTVGFDGAGRLVYGMEAGGVVGRMQLDGSDDLMFGTAGRSESACAGAHTQTLLVQYQRKLVLAGDCGGSVFAARFHDEIWTGATFTIAPTAPAGRASIPLDDATLQALAAVPAELQSSPLRGTPLRGTPLRGTPLRGTPLRGTPLRGTPLRGTPLRGTPLRGTALQTPLSSIPLIQDVPTDPTWSDVLAPTPYRDVPLTNVTLQQVLDLPTDQVDVLADVTLADIPLRGTPLRGTSISALLLGQVPLALLPSPDGGWCAFLASPGPHCPSAAGAPGVDPATWTLLDLELEGADLSAYFAAPLSLVGVDLRGSVLGNIAVADLDLPKTPLGGLPVDVLPLGLIRCSTCGATLGAVQQRGIANLDPDLTIAELLRSVVPQQLATVTLGDLLAGLVRAEDLPIEYLPLPPLLDRAPIRDDSNATASQYTARLAYDLHCDGTGTTPEPGVRVALPDGTRFVPGTQYLDLPGDGYFDASHGFAAPIVTPGTVAFDIPGPLCGVAVEDLALELSFRIDPPAVLGSLGPSSATISAGGVSETIPAAAPSTTVDRETPDDDTEAGAKAIAVNSAYTGHLGAAGDIDLFKIPAPPAGSTLAVTLSHLPADYDLSIYGEGDELPSTPLRGTPLRGTPLRGTPVGDALDEPTGSDAAGAEGLADIPLRGTPLRGTSINRGTEVESVSVLAKAADGAKGFLVQVSGFDGAHSDQPYVLRARVIPGPKPLTCPPRTFSSTGVAGTWPVTDQTPVPAGTQTLILVNQQRLGARYGSEAAQMAINRLQSLAARTDVKGLVLPVESAPSRTVGAKYQAWDDDPCSVANANAVVNEINLAVDSLRPHLADLRHIVLVGSDEILPQARIPDLTRLSNQRDYTDSVQFGGQDNAVSRAFLESNILSDEPYGDFDPQPWLSGKLYVADVGLGRLVERPEDIALAVDRFAAAGGVLAPSTSYVSGYDFLKDGARAVAAPLAELTTGIDGSRIDETWTASDAAAGITSVVPASTAPAGTAGLASVNAHYDHHQALPAAPFNARTSAPDQLLTTAELPGSLGHTLLFTMGCEAGLNIADVLVAGLGGTEAASASDWAQSVASRGGLFAGNTGYGYGDTEAVAYSERVMANFATGLAGRQATVGQAFMFAKQRYQAELGVAGVYDAKAMEEATFYGLPMYRVGATGVVAPSAVPAFDPPETIDTYSATDFDEQFQLTAHATARGTYYAVGGEDPQVTQYRPIQPRVDEEHPVVSGERIHGVVIEDLESTDLPDVDPAYATPTVDLGAHEPEATTRGSVFPAAIQAVSSKATPQGRRDIVVLMPGQFFGGDGVGGRGTQRLYDRIVGKTLRSSSTDFDAPQITTVEASQAGGQAWIEVTTPATDVTRVVALYRIGDDQTVDDDWHTVDLALGAGGWSKPVSVPAGKRVVDLLVQVVDAAGNVGISTNKGPGYRSEVAPPEDGEVDVTVVPSLASVFVKTPPTFTPGTGAVLTLSIDGGSDVPLTAATTISGEGTHRVVVRDVRTGVTEVFAFFTDTIKPTATITGVTDGATYVLGHVPTAGATCSDGAGGSGIASCDRSGGGSTVGRHTVAATATDLAGNTGTASVAYSVVTGYTFGPFSAPVDEGISNRTKAGSAVPVKFQVFDGDGHLVTDPSLVSIRSVGDCAPTTSSDTIEQTVVATSSSLKFDAATQRFIYVWKTDKAWTGCRKLILTAGGVEKVAYFQLTK